MLRARATFSWPTLYMQKFKTPLAPVYEINHIEYILQKLEDEITAFNTVQLKWYVIMYQFLFQLHFRSSHNYYIGGNITKVLTEF
jgi:hypothetical protein